ncbi:hypothetical protein ACFTTN_25835 [Streptomyces niveus]|uniref:hypothetical protein n=1 Tax=Streptomyces niveus TaxID=193462 RepID=UPI003641209A
MATIPTPTGRLLRTPGGVDLIQHRDTEAGLGDIGPGWEYYLDMLGASLDGTPRPVFEDYYPAQKAYFEGLTAQ